jgi:hypothetical protein
MQESRKRGLKNIGRNTISVVLAHRFVFAPCTVELGASRGKGGDKKPRNRNS